MAFEFKCERRVEFSETDMAGVVHFTQFLKYMEYAEHAFFNSLGLSVYQKLDGAYYGWPKLKVECGFEKPLRFEDRVSIHLLVEEKTSKCLTFKCTIFRITGAGQAERVGAGIIKTICVEFGPNGEKLGATQMPKPVDDAIQQAPASFQIA